MKRIWSVVLVLALMLSLMPMGAFGITASAVAPDVGEGEDYGTVTESGTCGDNLTWAMYDSGTLVISGEGAMQDYGFGTAPWVKLDFSNVIIGDSVTSIGAWAFSDSGLTSITIPDSVASIGAWAFYCTRLTSITIPDSVASIGARAFSECARLTSITIPDSVATIGDFAFEGCTHLTSITIPDSVTTIGDNAFLCCESLTSVTIGDSVTSIGDSAFDWCTSLTLLTIGNSVTSIGDSAFYSCDSLTSVTIPDSVTSIGEHAFNGCSSLTSVTIPDSVTSIGGYAFYKCPNLTIYGYSGSVAETYAAENDIPFVALDEEPDDGVVAYGSCGDNVTWTLYEDGTLVISGEGDMWDFWEGAPWGIEVLNVVIEDGVTSIGDCAFYYSTSLTSVTIPDSVTRIGGYAFEECSALVTVTIPDSVTSIGDGAFTACISLTSIAIPAAVSEIGTGVFSYCNSLESIDVAEDNAYFTSINGVLFNEDENLLIVCPGAKEGAYTIPSTVTGVDYYAFSNCVWLTSVTIPDSVTSIGACAFINCVSLSTVTIPDSVEDLGDYAFFACNLLRSVTVGSGVTSIGECAFANCESLADIELSEGLNYIGEWAFSACPALTSITIPNGVTSIGGYAFYNCPNLTIYGYFGSVAETYAAENGIPFVALDVEDTVTNSGTCGDNLTWALYDSGTLVISGEGEMWDYGFGTAPWAGLNFSTAIIQDGVTSIGDSAFSACSNLSAIQLPDSVTSIGIGTFMECVNLKEVAIPYGVTRIDSTFDCCVGLVSITIPESVTSINGHAFGCCYSLTSITIPDSVTNIDDIAFFDCPNLTIYGYSGSIAETYAAANDIPFVALDAPADEDAPAFVVGVPSGPVRTGDTFTVTVNTKNNPGIVGMLVRVGYDADVFELVSINGQDFGGTSFGPLTQNPIAVNWFDAINPNNTTNGVVAVLTFKVREDAALGDTAITLSYDSDDVYDYDFNNVMFATVDGVVEIVCGHAYDHACDTDCNFCGDVRVIEHIYDNACDADCNTIGCGVTRVPADHVYDHACDTDCNVCGNMRSIEHAYEHTVVPPTYFEHGYTVHTCAVCADTYRDAYVDPLERIDLSNAALELEYTSVYYKGIALTPGVKVFYEGEAYDASKELKIVYANNDRVGTATVTIEGVNKFKGTVELSFDISYEVIPKQIVNVVAIGEIGKISLSWGESSEVNTDCYRIYRKAEGETAYRLIKTISGRNVLSYEDRDVEKRETYSYYVTGVGLYGAESTPSLAVTATVLVDEVAPSVLKVSPAATSVISGKTTLSVTATDNVGVTKVTYFYTLDNGENWVAIGESTNSAFSIAFDTTELNSESVKVKAIAYDAEGNESDPIIVVYSLDNIGPDKVTGLSAVSLSSKITLSWDDVTASDAVHFILQTKSNGVWTTAANNITTLGYTITGLQPNTDYIYRVACVDAHGNVGEYSDEFTARTATDKTAPVITSQSPNSARYNSTISFSATAKDDCDVKTIEIQVSADLSSWTTISTKTFTARSYKQTYSYTISLSEYAEGSLFVRAIATDFSGNVSDTSGAAPYTEYILDRTAPEAPANVSANGQDGYITVSWSMGNEFDLGKYFVYKSTALDGEYQLIASQLTSLNYHDRDVQRGTEYYYKVRVSDACGNMSAYSSAVSSTMSPDTRKPEITSISATYQQKISTTTHTINVDATDNNKLSYIVVEYYTSVNAEYTQLIVEENINHYYKRISVTLPIDNLTDGDVICLRVYAVDMAGLRSDYAMAKYTLDTIAPTIRDFTVSLDAATVCLEWKGSGEGDLSGYKVYRSDDGETFTLLGSRGASSSGAYRFVDGITGKESKTYTYKIESIDRLGNTASWLKSVDYTYVYINQRPNAQMNTPDFLTVDVEEVFDASDSSDDIVVMGYLWDFGDGTTSTDMRAVKSYDAVGTYTVKLSVIDNEGAISTITKDIEVKERDLLGFLNVKVVDENGKVLPYVPVYFDLGSDNQKILYTNASGVATLQLPSGTHTIGMYASGYLPVKKDVVVLANATRTVTLTTVEEDIVTGNFEITRMTFDEIVAAGIDVYDPANQNVYSASVRVTYGSKAPLTINYVRNDDKIISYTVSDSNGKPVTHYTNSNGEKRKITGVAYIPSSRGNSDVVAIMDVPAEASYLKEFFNVKLHIVNNASSAFTLMMNEVVLNVPFGMTLMTSVSGNYSTSNSVKIDVIRGQETVTLSWALCGDKAGEYDLSADFTGTLAEFNELVTARFETKEPIKVYGLEGVKFRILVADEIHNDTLYFNVELENERDIDIYMPSIDLTNKIENVTESVLNGKAEDDFFADAYLLNVYIQTENGERLYIPFTYDANGKVTTAIKVLAPGQKIVYEYVAYNAINYEGVAYFEEAAVKEFEGILSNIETGSFHKERYSFTDYSAKLDGILSDSDADVVAAFNAIFTDANYYYWAEAEDEENGLLSALYKLADIVLNADITHFTEEEKRELIRATILSILSDSSVIEQADQLVMKKYNAAVKEMIDLVETGTIQKYIDKGISAKDIAGVFEDIAKNSKSLAITYRTEGSDAFKKELSAMIAKSSLKLSIDASTMITLGDEAEIFSKAFGKAKTVLFGFLNAVEESERDAYYYSVLKLQCNSEISERILDAIIRSAGMVSQNRYKDADLIRDVAVRLKNDLNTNMADYYARLDYENLVKEFGEVAAKAAIKTVVKKIIGSTPLAVVSAGFNALDTIFGFDHYYKQQDSMCVYDALTVLFTLSFVDSTAIRIEENDFYSMLYLMAICELRLSGEQQFKSFMDDYKDGVYGKPLKEGEIVEKINKIQGTDYKLLDEWWDDVQYNIIHARDILFNVEATSSVEIPRAPVVTLDYDKLQTVQSFTSDYEYCFADGVWKRCTNGPITFAVGVTPSILRVRKAAGSTNLAGDITTVRIFARKDLSKLITAKFDGVNYMLDNLSPNRYYQVVFTDDLGAIVDWSKAKTIAGSDSVRKISGVGEHSYIIIRSCQNADLYETTSNPLVLIVSKKTLLDLVIDGSGSVSQTASTGSYFDGESVDLIATPNAGCSFVGWYIDGVCVSTNEHYIVEMSDGLKVIAQFTGAKIKNISIEELPTKLHYYEGESLDLNGIKLLVTYSDNTTAYVEQFAAYLSSNTAGKSTVVITYGGFTVNYDVTINHTYAYACDSTCNVCGESREVTHKYDNACDTDCNECGDVRVTEHVYNNACDADCNICGDTRIPADHVYDHACDTDCNECGDVRVTEHAYDNACDAVCNVCGNVRTVGEHVYDNDGDRSCNICGHVRVVTPVSAELNTLPDKVVYAPGEALDTAGLTLLLTYGDGTLEITDRGYSVSGYNPYTLGAQTVTVIYEAFTILFDITVSIPVIDEDAPAFVANTPSGPVRTGDTFTVTVNIKNNPGIVSLKVMAGYDAEVFELMSIDGKDFSGTSFGPLNNNPISVNWIDTLNPNNETDGAVAVLTFKVREDAALGDTAITLSYNPNDVYDYDFENVEFASVSGAVRVVDYFPGDVNDDGYINNKDLGLLQRYINGWDIDIHAAAGDVNGDGLLNNKDLGLLQRYINGWDVELK